MPRVSPLLATFNAGEWDPTMWGRSDYPKYNKACRRLENFFPKVQGPVVRRPGTRYVATSKSNGVARLQDFQYNDEQSYCLEFGDTYVRFFREQGQISGAASTAAVTNGDFATDLSGWTASSVSRDAGTASALFAGGGTLEQSISCTANVEHVVRFKLNGTAGTDKLDLRVGSSSGGAQYLALTTFDVGWHCYSFTPTASPFYLQFVQKAGAPYLDDVALCSGVAVEIGSPWSGASQLFGLATVQEADTMYIATATVRPYKLTRTGHARWSLKPVVFTAAPAEWTGSNWPRAVTLHEKRSVWGGEPNMSNRIRFSQTASLENLTNGTNATDGMEYKISMQKVPVIRWLNAGKTLQVGALGAEINVQASSLNEAITPTNVQVRPETTVGCAAVPPVRVGRAVLFVQRSGERLHEFVYDWQGDSFAAPEMTLLARHITRGGIKQLAFAQTPEPMIWAVMTNGNLASLTYDRAQDVIAWSRHPLGGTDVNVISAAVISGTTQDEVWLLVERTINGATKRYVEFIEYEYRPENVDDKWQAFYVDSGLTLDSPVAQTLTPGTGATTQATTGVIFTAGGSAFSSGDVGREIRYRYTTGTDPDDRYKTARALITGYTDATHVTATILSAFPSLTAIAASGWYLTSTTVTGLDHLEGQTVQVLVDGAAHPDKTVASGAITLDRRGAVVHAGLGYSSVMETLDLEIASQTGTGLGKQQRISKATVKFNETLGARVGYGDTLETIPFRRGSDPMDDSPPLFTGIKTVAFPKGWNDADDAGARVKVVQDQPLPCTVVAVAPVLTTNEG